MASIPQPSLFSWKEVQSLGDLDRLLLVLRTIPDEALVCRLEKLRGNKGRNDYPVRATWNSLLAGIVFQHESIESLRRELLRNAQLRELCGFDLFKGEKAVPSSWAYSRFMVNLLKHSDDVDAIFSGLVNSLGELLPDLAKELAFDSKALHSLAKGQRRSLKAQPYKQEPGKRRDNDADWGMKGMSYIGPKGQATTTKRWFGYKLHAIVDAKYELPLSFSLTEASKQDAPSMRTLFNGFAKEHPNLVDRCSYAMGDKGYDCTESINQLLSLGIKPIIPIKNNWQAEGAQRFLPGDSLNNITYDYTGTLHCSCPSTAEDRKLVFQGYEPDRGTLRYQCPAKAYGVECAGSASCKASKGLRLPTSLDTRRFTPLPRSTYKWGRLYKMRTTVERVFSRLDVSLGFEHHYIRGMAKMKLRCALAFGVMLSMALGRIREERLDLIRSLVKAA